MSEYQYYEWEAIDRPLTEAEQAEVNRLSSHIDVTSTRALVTYNWGDFKHDEQEVLAKYFDAFLYHFNWGSQRLLFRFPKNLLDVAQLKPYLWEYLEEDEQRELEAAEAQRIQELESWAPREEQTWRHIDALIHEKTTRSYDDATMLLIRMRDLAIYRDRLPQFQARLAELQAQYPKRPALLERLRGVAQGK